MSFSTVVQRLGNMKITAGTMDASDDNFTFDVDMRRVQFATPAAIVSLYLAASSTSGAKIVLPANVITPEFNWDTLANKQVTFVGTSSQVITVIEYCGGSTSPS